MLQKKGKRKYVTTVASMILFKCPTNNMNLGDGKDKFCRESEKKIKTYRKDKGKVRPIS